jgi:hypothetical protein
VGPDRIGLKDGVNRYSYVKGGPTTSVDMQGTETLPLNDYQRQISSQSGSAGNQQPRAGVDYSELDSVPGLPGTPKVGGGYTNGTRTLTIKPWSAMPGNLRNSTTEPNVAAVDIGKVEVRANGKGSTAFSVHVEYVLYAPTLLDEEAWISKGPGGDIVSLREHEANHLHVFQRAFRQSLEKRQAQLDKATNLKDADKIVQSARAEAEKIAEFVNAKFDARTDHNQSIRPAGRWQHNWRVPWEVRHAEKLRANHPERFERRKAKWERESQKTLERIGQPNVRQILLESPGGKD